MSDPRIAAFFVNPSAPAAHKEAILEQVLENAQPEMRNLVRLLSERERLDLVPRIFSIYEDGLRAERGIAIAEVTTAEPLGVEEQELVRDRLANLVGKKIEMHLTVDPDIIGGIIARVGDQLIDGSVISQLRRLRARLAATG